MALAKREVFWQNQLRCYIQNWGHAHCYRKENNYPRGSNLFPPPSLETLCTQKIQTKTSAYLIDQRTSSKVSCGDGKMENFLSIEQKQVIKFVYKNGERIENSQSRIEFLKKSLDNNFIQFF